MLNFFKALYFHRTLYIAGIVIVIALMAGYVQPFFYALGKTAFFTLLGLAAIDALLLFRAKEGIVANRLVPEKLSNGDENDILMPVRNRYGFKTRIEIIEEAPVQFQLRELTFQVALSPGEEKTLRYFIRPTERGEYVFGRVNAYARSPLGLVIRRYTFDADVEVPVYPSFLQMRKYELLAISNRLTEAGIKKIRRIGQNREFDQIREYVNGDDFRTMNWKATARRGSLMVNQYQDERSQNVFSVIDKGRIMQMPFEGLTLLDYAINASLVISNIAIQKSDKAGLITFNRKVTTVVKASNRNAQMRQIQEALYKERTRFHESSFERLYIGIRRNVTQRSLIILYTNFETMSGLKRQMHHLRAIAKSHLLVVIFFSNTELDALVEAEARTTEDIYLKTIGEQFEFEKRQIVKELGKYGIHAILTAPENLTVNTINKYLEIKARGLL